MSRLLTLSEAAATLHPTITVETLRKAIRRGRLRAGKYETCRYYVTPEDLEDFAKCPGSDCRPASTFETTNDSGSSETEPSRSGRAQALASVERLKKRSRHTSQTDQAPSDQGRRAPRS